MTSFNITSTFIILLYFVFAGLLVYLLILLIKLARRAIKAFDIYINEKGGQ